MEKGEDEQGGFPLGWKTDNLQPCNNKCFCKRCCYHCQLCFLQKGLGINYAPRPRRKKVILPYLHRSISTRGGNSQTTQEEKTTVERDSRPNQASGRKNLEHKTRGSIGARD
ncbi:tat protein [Simian immunodeficiency virus - agm]|uniref:Protein Tat n=1 Tax=Simian immunodeficiency virus - agm TaxID=11726 RepID=A0A1B4WRK0_SIV|nr:tat protein [Simian immunodeficiency virus - agm]